jgi:Leucyl aminopeptidase
MGVIKKLVKRKEFEGLLGQQAYIASPEGLSAERLYLIGFGKSTDSLSSADLDKTLNSIINSIKSSKSKNVSICFPSLKYSNDSNNDSWFLQKMSTFLENKVYTYDAKLNKKNKAINYLKKVGVYLDSSLSANKQRKALKTGQVIGQGMNAAKDLANLPGNICTPSYLASTSRSAAKIYAKLNCKVFGEIEMKKMGMDCLLSVGNGSAQESKLISMSYQGGKKDDQPYAIVGKGITFDTGGISLKPGAAMDEMKFDMCGAASVIATMQVVAELKLPINVVGVVASAENMPGSKATKPGDVVKTMSGVNG